MHVTANEKALVLVSEPVSLPACELLTHFKTRDATTSKNNFFVTPPCMYLRDVVAADESDAGQLGVVLVYPLRRGAVRVVLAGVSSDPDQRLVVNSDTVSRVQTLLGVVLVRQEYHVDSCHGKGNTAPLVDVWGHHEPPRPVPREQRSISVYLDLMHFI